MLYEVITNLDDYTKSEFIPDKKDSLRKNMLLEYGVITSYSIHYTKLYEGYSIVEFMKRNGGIMYIEYSNGKQKAISREAT